MRKFTLALAALLLLPWLAACAGQPNTLTADLGQQVSLARGQSVSINGEGLTIQFAGVISDSRCPQGATCIWAGEASCRLEIGYSGETSEKVIVQPGLTAPASSDFAGYGLTFDVQPYPKLGETIKDDQYRLLLTVVRGAS